jgi:Xaa-Pro aminopeptidase
MALIIQQDRFSDAQLEKFKRHQRQSYEILEDCAAALKAGMTEQDAARAMRKGFHLAGARGYFHVPVVLFGDRTAYPGAFGPFEAISTDRVLKDGDAVILDAAPIFDGYKVDTSYAFSFGQNAHFDAADAALVQFRDLLVNLIKDGLSYREVAWKIDDRIKEAGFENCHKKHIGAVLGHRLSYAPQYPIRMPKIWGLAPRQVSWFFYKSLQSRLGAPAATPNWNASRQCRTKPKDGLWAMEPHIARDGVGVKFEEILVIDKDNVYWLDDDLPHTRRWTARKVAA